MKGTEIITVEIHMLQNFAPSNLNRDDTGSPKDCNSVATGAGEFPASAKSEPSGSRSRKTSCCRPKTSVSAPAASTTAVADRLKAQGWIRIRRWRWHEAVIPGLGLKLDKGQTQYHSLPRQRRTRPHRGSLLRLLGRPSGAQADAGASKKKAKEVFPKEIALIASRMR